MKSQTGLELLNNLSLDTFEFGTLASLNNGVAKLRVISQTYPGKVALGFVDQGTDGSKLLVQANASVRAIIEDIFNASGIDEQRIPTAKAVLDYFEQSHGVFNAWTGSQSIPNTYDSGTKTPFLPNAVVSHRCYASASQLEFVFYNTALGNTAFMFPKYYQGAQYPDSNFTMKKAQTYVSVSQNATKYYCFDGICVFCEYDKTTREIKGITQVNNVDFIRTTNNTSTQYNWTTNTEKGGGRLTGINIIV